MLQVCAPGPVTLGVDLSHWNPVKSWDSFKLTGAVFSFFKATEGLRTLDDTFKTDWATAPKYNIIRGAYHFLHPSEDPVAQAKLFVSVMGKLSPTDLPPVMDWETTDNEPANHDLEAGIAFLEYVKKATGRRPIIYGGSYFLEALQSKWGPEGDPRLAAYSLWLSQYPKVMPTHAFCPTIPKPFRMWDFWQFTDKYNVSNMTANHRADGNYFNGDETSLQMYITHSMLHEVTPALTEKPTEPKITNENGKQPLQEET